MIDSRSLDDLHPAVAARARRFIQLCDDAGIKVIPTCTFRDFEMQAELYARGRTKPGNIVTNARPGESYHQYKVALDFVPIVDGKAVWNDDHLWNECGRIAEFAGFEWSGRWRGSLREKAHIQYTNGLSLARLKAGEVPK